MTKTSKISKQTFELIEAQVFNGIELPVVQEGLDNMFFQFINNGEEISDSERSIATWSYFALKKLMQSIKEKTDPSNVETVEVNLGIYG